MTEARLESLGIVLKVEGQRFVVFDKEGKPILPLEELVRALTVALEQERAKREELERKLAELEAKLKKP